MPSTLRPHPTRSPHCAGAQCQQESCNTNPVPCPYTKCTVQIGCNSRTCSRSIFRCPPLLLPPLSPVLLHSSCKLDHQRFLLSTNAPHASAQLVPWPCLPPSCPQECLPLALGRQVHAPYPAAPVLLTHVPQLFTLVLPPSYGTLSTAPWAPCPPHAAYPSTHSVHPMTAAPSTTPPAKARSCRQLRPSGHSSMAHTASMTPPTKASR